MNFPTKSPRPAGSVICLDMIEEQLSPCNSKNSFSEPQNQTVEGSKRRVDKSNNLAPDRSPGQSSLFSLQNILQHRKKRPNESEILSERPLEPAMSTSSEIRPSSPEAHERKNKAGIAAKVKNIFRIHSRETRSPDDDDNDNDDNIENERPSNNDPPPSNGVFKKYTRKVLRAMKQYGRFIGPGFMISVAYMDPGNYSTDVAAGAQFRFSLLFVVLLSNCIAIYLQSLAIKLGTVSGRDLAQVSRDELPMWLNLILYILAEIAIICTDIAEVIGTAVALNILLHIPLIAGVVITILDVLIVLLAHRPGNSMTLVRVFEYGVACLVLGVVICFAIQLAHIPEVPVGDVFRGFLPSHQLIEGDALYAACGILGATVMPHSLYLGSAIVKPRLLDYDLTNGNLEKETQEDIQDGFYDLYRPSLAAIRHALRFSIIELAIALFTFALFVNSAILIVAGATIYGTENADNADLYSIHDTLSTLLSASAGTIFMLALLFSGQSAGIICTIAGQIVSEGYLHWSVKPWVRRLFTRSIAIVPCLIVTGAVGKKGLNATLNASQVALSILLPFLIAPLIYFTCKNSVMTIQKSAVPQSQSNQEDLREDGNAEAGHPEDGIFTNPGEVSPQQSTPDPRSTTAVPEVLEVFDTVDHYRAGKPLTEPVSFRNNWFTTIVGILVWLFIAILNVYLMVCLGLGKS